MSELEPMVPMPFQRADIDGLLAHTGRGFVMAEPGCGKTLIGVQVGLEGDMGTRLVIAPKGTHKRVWQQTIEQQDPNAVVRRLDSTAKGKDAMNALEWGEEGWYLITPQLFTKWKLEQVRVDLAIADEAHLLGGGGAGSHALRKLKAGARLPMSGTMVRNKVENFWPLLRWVYPDMRGPRELADINRHRWILEYMATEYDRFAPGNIKIVGERVPGRIASEIPCYVQHFKRAECCAFHPHGFLHDVPAPRHMVETVELTAEQRKLIMRMEATYVAWLEQEARDADRALVARLPIDARIRLRQMTLAVPSFDENGTLRFAPGAASPKIDKLIEIHEHVNEPIVASTSSKLFAHECVRRLNERGIRAFEWSSAAKQAERDQALVDFERGDYDVIVGVTEAIGTGIDGLQAASGVLVSLERSEDLASEIQLESRLDRRGQRRADGVLHYEIIAEGSMDEGIVSRQLQKRLDLNKSLRRQTVRAAA